MRIEMREQGIEGARFECRVGVQEEEVLRPGAPRGQVRTGGETEVPGGFMDEGCGTRGPHRLRRPVPGEVIDQRHFRFAFRR